MLAWRAVIAVVVLASLVVVELEELLLGDAVVTSVSGAVVGELSVAAPGASVVVVVVVVVQSSDVVSFVQSVHSSRSASGSKS